MISNFRIAYILQIHKNADQVNKFINQLITNDHADVYIHIDKKSYTDLHDQIQTGPNIKIVNESFDCEWGDIGQVDTTLLLMKEVLASKKHYHYVCLRSGQDLLIKEGFSEFLQVNDGKIYMKHRKMVRSQLGLMRINWPKFTRKRYTTAHPIRILRRLLLMLYSIGIPIIPNRNKWPKTFSFYKGSQWITMPFEVMEYILDFLDQHKWYHNYFQNTLVPDESFFHTLIMNSPYKKDVVNSNLYFLKWGETFQERNSPQNLTKSDIPVIEQSNQFFARKFDETIDKEVIDYFYKKITARGASIMVENKQDMTQPDRISV